MTCSMQPTRRGGYNIDWVLFFFIVRWLDYVYLSRIYHTYTVALYFIRVGLLSRDLNSAYEYRGCISRYITVKCTYTNM